MKAAGAATAATDEPATRSASPPAVRRARILGLAAVLLGGGSYVVLPTPLPSAFPWLTLVLSLGGIAAAVVALRLRRRGRLATGLACIGLALCLAFPALVVFVLVRYLNFSA